MSPGVIKSVEDDGYLLCYNAHADLDVVFTFIKQEFT